MFQIKDKHYSKEDRMKEAIKAFEYFKIDYTAHNMGLHWKFTYSDVEYNYFPTTGKWYTKNPRHSCTCTQRYLGGLLKTLGLTVKEIETL